MLLGVILWQGRLRGGRVYSVSEFTGELWWEDKRAGACSCWSLHDHKQQKVTNAFCSASFLHLYNPGSQSGDGTAHSGWASHLTLIKIVPAGMSKDHLSGDSGFRKVDNTNHRNNTAENLDDLGFKILFLDTI